MTIIILTGVMGVVVIALLIAAFRCTHAWEFVDKTEFPSPIETATKNGVSTYSFWNSQLEEMSKKTIVIVLRCPKCGSAKILRETH